MVISLFLRFLRPVSAFVINARNRFSEIPSFDIPETQIVCSKSGRLIVPTNLLGGGVELEASHLWAVRPEAQGSAFKTEDFTSVRQQSQWPSAICWGNKTWERSCDLRPAQFLPMRHALLLPESNCVTCSEAA